MSLVKILIIGYIIKLINLIICYMMVHPVKEHFLYFAYGSNMLKRRLRINNPSAEFIGIGCLENHQLDFVHYFENWGGAVATIAPKENENVWGAIWQLHKGAIATLDRQEEVDKKVYFPKTVNIKIPDGKEAECRTYQHTVNPPELKSIEDLPEDRRPSITYKEVILRGAIENNLPEDYIKMLKNIPHNGKHASDQIRQQLDL